MSTSQLRLGENLSTSSLKPLAKQEASGQIKLENSQETKEVKVENRPINRFVQACIQQPLDLLSTVSKLLLETATQKQPEATIIPSKQIKTHEPINNNMQFLFGVIKIKAFDTAEHFLKNPGIQQAITDHLGDRNSENETLLDALQAAKKALVDRQREREDRRFIEADIVEATLPIDASEEDQEASNKMVASLKKLATSLSKIEHKSLDPILQNIDDSIQIVRKLEAIKCPF